MHNHLRHVESTKVAVTIMESRTSLQAICLSCASALHWPIFLQYSVVLLRGHHSLFPFRDVIFTAMLQGMSWSNFDFVFRLACMCGLLGASQLFKCKFTLFRK